MLLRLLALSALLVTGTVETLANDGCGAGKACIVDGGSYRIALPADDDVRGAYVFFHGFKSSSELQMQHTALVETALAHHLAFVAIDGVDGSWSFPNAPRQDRDEKAFVARVLDDLRGRYGITSDKLVIGGFSIGASMAWYTACEQGEKAAAMVTFSGVFWDPLPKPGDCIADVPRMIHFHGTADRTFPLQGRAIGTDFHQGNALDSMAIMRARAKCDSADVKEISVDGIACNEVRGCIRGESVMCIHNGGHEVRADMLDAGLTEAGFSK